MTGNPEGCHHCGQKLIYPPSIRRGICAACVKAGATASGGTQAVSGDPTQCTWCGHDPHSDTCTRQIVTQSGPTYAPCPCARHLKGSTV